MRAPRLHKTQLITLASQLFQLLPCKGTNHASAVGRQTLSQTPQGWNDLGSRMFSRLLRYGGVFKILSSNHGPVVYMTVACFPKMYSGVTRPRASTSLRQASQKGWPGLDAKK